jgi:hypothetical protein
MDLPPKISPMLCPNCRTEFILDESGGLSDGRCGKCNRSTQLFVFPALSRRIAPARADNVMIEGESACFYHAGKRAVIPCDLCGRFLCGLCDLEFAGQHLCPQCLEAGSRKGHLQSLERSRTRWDQIASASALLPLVFCWILLPVTALATLGIAIWKWNAPPSMIVRTKLHLGIASVFAVLEFVGGIAGWWFMVFSR